MRFCHGVVALCLTIFVVEGKSSSIVNRDKTETVERQPNTRTSTTTRRKRRDRKLLRSTNGPQDLHQPNDSLPQQQQQNTERGLEWYTDDDYSFDDDFRIMDEAALPNTCQVTWDFHYLAHDLVGGCSYDRIVQEMHSEGCWHDMETELRFMLGVETDAQAAALINQACTDATNYIYNDPHHPLSFSSVLGYDSPRWDKAYLDGGTAWHARPSAQYHTHQHHLQSEDIQWMYEWQRYDTRIAMPTGVENVENCQFRTVLCCTTDHQHHQYETDYDPAPDNTDVCYVDMSRSPTSNRVKAGFALMERDDEGWAHCEGFVWSNDETDVSALFRGNNLFYHSMYRMADTRGYQSPLPGAPLCACVEQMPTVTRADCHQVDVVGLNVTIQLSPHHDPYVCIDYYELDFTPCEGTTQDNDLVSHFELQVQRGKATQEELDVLTSEYLVGEGNCGLATEDFLHSQWMDARNPVELINDDSGRHVYATRLASSSGLQNYAEGVGAATTSTMRAGYDTRWGFKATSCPGGNDQKTDSCYLIVNYNTHRRLFAEKGKVDTDGVGAASGGIRNDQKWKIEKHKCADERSACYQLINADSLRALFADRGSSFASGFGADTVVNRTSFNWQIDGIENLATTK